MRNIRGSAHKLNHWPGAAAQPDTQNHAKLQRKSSLWYAQGLPLGQFVQSRYGQANFFFFNFHSPLLPASTFADTTCKHKMISGLQLQQKEKQLGSTLLILDSKFIVNQARSYSTDKTSATKNEIRKSFFTFAPAVRHPSMHCFSVLNMLVKTIQIKTNID